MRVREIKAKMKKWKDLAGFDLSADIDSIKTKEEAKAILTEHYNWLDNLANDAQRSVDRFRKELGL